MGIEHISNKCDHLFNSLPSTNVSLTPAAGREFRQSALTAGMSVSGGKPCYLPIEVADATLNYDLKRKGELYVKAKIFDYWVIDVKLCQVHVFREPMQNSYQQKSILAFNDSLALVAFPNLIVSIRELFPQQFLNNL